MTPPTTDIVERLAREAGFQTLALDLAEGQEPTRLIQPVSSTDISVELRKFRALVLEEAAKICMALETDPVNTACPSAVNGWWPDQVAHRCALAIRALAEGVR